MAETITQTYYDVYPVLTPVNIYEFSAKDWRSAIVYLQASAGSEHQMTELSLIHDNDKVYLRETNTTYTQDPYISMTARLVDNVISLWANSEIANADIVVYAIQMEIINKSASDTTISQDKLLAGAAAMKALYPDDTTDYVKAQAGSLFKEHLVAELDREVKDVMAILTSATFVALSTAEQDAKMRELTAQIELRKTAIQDSIDADIAAKNEIDNKIESAGIVTGIATSYQDPNAKTLLDLTLNTSTKTALANAG